MTRFATGLVAGGIIGAIGLSYAMQDRKVRRNVVRGGRQAMHKAEEILDNVTDMF